jgi:alkanesulfonate monooxygenase SsuD/methylene tetrahydromethanopterin reductase-like flavin-dependent oxidoreductase (luciferase family)
LQHRFTGTLFDDKGVRILLKPVQQPHPPFWGAASRSDDTYRRAGEKGFHLLTLPYMCEPEVLRNSIDHYIVARITASTSSNVVPSEATTWPGSPMCL